MFNILSEEKILFAGEAFKNLGNVTLCKGNRLTAKDLKHIDILLIRSGTRVDHALLDGTPVQFVASATVGTDHVNKAYLRANDIPFYHAPGCNAEAVVEYVIAALLNVSAAKSERLAGKTVGIIGAGNIGGRLAKRLAALGMEILVNDPLLFGDAPDSRLPFRVVPLDELLASADIVTTHTPLTKSGEHATFHLLNERRLLEMKPGAWLVNASRGAVISHVDLKKVVQTGRLGAVILDVWEDEPSIDMELMDMVDIATPHIAGHSYEGKVNGTIQIYESFIQHYKMDSTWDAQRILAPSAEDKLDLDVPDVPVRTEDGLRALVDQMYDISADDLLFRKSMTMSADDRTAFFLRLRKEYPRRRSFLIHELTGTGQLGREVEQALTQGLGIKVA